ncbi:hypothetical protein V6Z12_A13G003900 [Gossypium hirsutum]
MLFPFLLSFIIKLDLPTWWTLYLPYLLHTKPNPSHPFISPPHHRHHHRAATLHTIEKKKKTCTFRGYQQLTRVNH